MTTHGNKRITKKRKMRGGNPIDAMAWAAKNPLKVAAGATALSAAIAAGTAIGTVAGVGKGAYKTAQGLNRLSTAAGVPGVFSKVSDADKQKARDELKSYANNAANFTGRLTKKAVNSTNSAFGNAFSGLKNSFSKKYQPESISETTNNIQPQQQPQQPPEQPQQPPEQPQQPPESISETTNNIQPEQPQQPIPNQSLILDMESPNKTYVILAIPITPDFSPDNTRQAKMLAVGSNTNIDVLTMETNML